MKSLFFPHRVVLVLIKNQLNIEVWIYFWTQNSIPLTYIYLLLLPQWLYFVVSLKLWSLSPSNLLFFFNIILPIQCMHDQSLQLCPTLYNSMDCSPPGPSVCGILLARILEWIVMPSSRGSSRPSDKTPSSLHSLPSELPEKPLAIPYESEDQIFHICKKGH